MQKLVIACIAACAVLGGIATTNAQMRDGSHAGGGGFHDGGGSRDGGEFHGGGGFRHGERFHGRDVFRGPPIILAPGYYPYGYPDPYAYSYPYGDYSGPIYWYCPNPQGYYPDAQSCPGGWMQVIPDS